VNNTGAFSDILGRAPVAHTERISSGALARVGLNAALAPTCASEIRFDEVGRVGLGGCTPRAPTDPYVLALEHTLPLIMDSPCS
jgi:hypothetical protein